MSPSCVFQEDEFELTDLEEYDENGDIFADATSISGVCVYPAACRVIYSYQVNTADTDNDKHSSQ